MASHASSGTPIRDADQSVRAQDASSAQGVGVPASRANPLRVVHVLTTIDPAKGTGPAEALRALALEQARRGLAVTIVTLDADDAIGEPLRQAGVRVLATGPARALRGGVSTGATIRRVIRGDVDVVHIHGMWQYLPHTAAREARRAGVPYIVRSAGMLEPWALRKGWLKKK